MGVLWHKSGVRFSRPSLAKTELVTIVAFGKLPPPVKLSNGCVRFIVCE